MAELNQFQRSKDRLIEILYQLKYKDSADPKTASYIEVLEMSIRTLDHKMEEFMVSREIRNPKAETIITIS